MEQEKDVPPTPPEIEKIEEVLATPEPQPSAPHITLATDATKLDLPAQPDTPHPAAVVRLRREKETDVPPPTPQQAAEILKAVSPANATQVKSLPWRGLLVGLLIVMVVVVLLRQRSKKKS